jgi:hypothetical protein
MRMISIEAEFQIRYSKKFWSIIYVCSSNHDLEESETLEFESYHIWKSRTRWPIEDETKLLNQSSLSN